MSLVFMDLETVPDRRRVESGEGVDYSAYIDLLRDQTGDENPFVPWVYHRPVSLALVFVGDGVIKAAVYEEGIAQQWWQGWEKSRAKIVTWNGRGFDLPVLEAAAVREGIQVPAWLAPTGQRKNWEDPRSRYSGTHLDLLDYATNLGGARRVSMSAYAAAVGVPGKLDTRGDDVASMHAAGKIAEISGYCCTDVLTLMGVYSRISACWDGQELLLGTVQEAASKFSELGEAIAKAVKKWEDSFALHQPERTTQDAT